MTKKTKKVPKFDFYQSSECSKFGTLFGFDPTATSLEEFITSLLGDDENPTLVR